MIDDMLQFLATALLTMIACLAATLAILLAAGFAAVWIGAI